MKLNGLMCWGDIVHTLSGTPFDLPFNGTALKVGSMPFLGLGSSLMSNLTHVVGSAPAEGSDMNPSTVPRPFSIHIDSKLGRPQRVPRLHMHAAGMASGQSRIWRRVGVLSERMVAACVVFFLLPQVQAQTIYQPEGAILNGPTFCFQIRTASGFKHNKEMATAGQVPYFSDATRLESVEAVLFVRVIERKQPNENAMALVATTQENITRTDNKGSHETVDIPSPPPNILRPLSYHRYRYVINEHPQTHYAAYIEEEKNIIFIVHMATIDNKTQAVGAINERLKGYRYFGDGCQVTVLD